MQPAVPSEKFAEKETFTVHESHVQWTADTSELGHLNFQKSGRGFSVKFQMRHSYCIGRMIGARGTYMQFNFGKHKSK